MADLEVYIESFVKEIMGDSMIEYWCNNKCQYFADRTEKFTDLQALELIDVIIDNYPSSKVDTIEGDKNGRVYTYQVPIGNYMVRIKDARNSSKESLELDLSRNKE